MRKYSQAYTKIVKDHKDVQGIVAYSIYKQQKIEWIANFQNKNNRAPEEQDLEIFHESVLTETSINSYKASADNLLQKYGEIVFRKKVQQMSSIDKRINKRKWYWSGVGQSVFGSFIFAILVVIFGWIITSQKGGIKELLQAITDGIPN